MDKGNRDETNQPSNHRDHSDYCGGRDIGERGMRQPGNFVLVDVPQIPGLKRSRRLAASESAVASA